MKTIAMCLVLCWYVRLVSTHSMIWVSSLFSFCAFVTEIVNGKKAEPGGCPAIDISIEFEIQWKFVMLLFITNSADHIEVLHTSRQ